MIDDSEFGRPFADALRMLCDGLDVDVVRRQFANSIVAERARLDERAAVLATCLDLIAVGETPSYVAFCLRSVVSA
jgi:hypothetical protein